jgi:hypothetical protein
LRGRLRLRLLLLLLLLRLSLRLRLLLRLRLRRGRRRVVLGAELRVRRAGLFKAWERQELPRQVLRHDGRHDCRAVLADGVRPRRRAALLDERGLVLERRLAVLEDAVAEQRAALAAQLAPRKQVRLARGGGDPARASRRIGHCSPFVKFKM